MTDTKIFAVVVTYNGSSFIQQCLAHLQASSIEITIVVVDNASKDETVSQIKTGFPGVLLLESSENLGFGKANNIGIKHAIEHGASHIFLVNQDAYVEKKCAEKLAIIQNHEPEFGIVSPLHLRGDGSKLDARFALFVGRSHDTDNLLTDYLLQKTPKEIYQLEFINAAIWMLSKRCIETVGLFNPSFFHYGEDEDYAYRVYYHGLKIGVVPSLCAIHDRFQGKTGVSTEKAMQMNRADLIRRLSRVDYSVTHNLNSVVFAWLASSVGRNESFLVRIATKARIGIFIFLEIYKLLKNRQIAKAGGYCFAARTDQDAKILLRR